MTQLARLRQPNFWVIQLFFLIITGLSVAILVQSGSLYLTDDSLFHLGRMNELTFALTHHNDWLVPFSYQSFNGCGSAIQQFYPNITFLPFAWLRLVIANPVDAYYVGLGLYTYLGLVLAYAALRSVWSDRWRPVVFAVLYVFSVYRMSNVFGRFAVGEWLGMLFLPLVLAGIYHIAVSDSRKWWLLSAGMTLTLYSHLLSGVFAALVVLCGCAVLLFCRRGHFWRRVRHLSYAVSWTLLLTAFQLYALFRLSINNDIVRPFQPDMTIGYDMVHYVAASAANTLNKTNGWPFLVVAVGFLLVWRQASHFAKTAYVGMLVLAFLATNTFPWGLLQETPVNFLQFPFRFGALVALCLAIAGSELLYRAVICHAQRIPAVLVLAAVVSLSVAPGLLATQDAVASCQQRVPVTTSDNVSQASSRLLPKDYNQLVSIAARRDWSSDYIPAPTLPVCDQIFQRVWREPSGATHPLDAPTFTNNTLTCTLTSSRDQYVDLPFLYYYGGYYRATVNGKLVPLTANKYQLCRLPVVAGDNQITIVMQTPVLRNWLLVAAGGGWLSLFAYAWRQRHSDTKQTPQHLA